VSKFGIVSVALIEEVFVLLELVFIVIYVARVSLGTIGILRLSVVVSFSRLARWHQ